MKINKEWHLSHLMPPNPTTDQRIEWHKAHAQHCGCREIPLNLRALMKEQGIEIFPHPKKKNEKLKQLKKMVG
jgi:hypothetical protein